MKLFWQRDPSVRICTLSSGKMHLTQFGEPLIHHGSHVSSVDFHLDEEDIVVHRDWGMSAGDQVVIVESDLVRGDLSVNGTVGYRINF